MNSCGIAAGARETYEAIKAELEKRNLNIKLKIVAASVCATASPPSWT